MDVLPMFMILAPLGFVGFCIGWLSADRDAAFRRGWQAGCEYERERRGEAPKEGENG